MVEEQPELHITTEVVEGQETHLVLVLYFLHLVEELVEEGKQTLLLELHKVLQVLVEEEMYLQGVQAEEVLRLLCLL